MITSYSDIDDQLYEISLNNYSWSKNVENPNSKCLSEINRVFELLYYDYSILPVNITQCIEGGITAEFYNSDNRIKVLLEFYNNGGGIVAGVSGSKIFDSIDLDENNREEISPKIVRLILNGSKT